MDRAWPAWPQTHAASQRNDDPPTTERSSNGKPLDADQQREVDDLKRRDAEVRAHEAAHASAAAGHGGGPHFSYTTGPDGKRYATGGEVPIQIASGRTPEETIRNAQQVHAAALAPAEPSGQDRAVAAEAAAMEADARREMARRRGDEPAAGGASASSEPSQTLQQLESEQRIARKGWQHLHSSDGCGSCARGVAAYR